LVLYDGLRALPPRGSFIAAPDRRRFLRFAPLQGPTAKAVLERHPRLAGVDSIVYVRRNDDDERVSVESDAMLDILAELGVLRLAAWAARWTPRALRDAAYRAMAKRRYRWFGRYETCRIPAAGDPRFLP
jgi:predicted DCC family thiol-disulfide oxidoreductase YuxK